MYHPCAGLFHLEFFKVTTWVDQVDDCLLFLLSTCMLPLFACRTHARVRAPCAYFIATVTEALTCVFAPLLLTGETRACRDQAQEDQGAHLLFPDQPVPPDPHADALREPAGGPALRAHLPAQPPRRDCDAVRHGPLGPGDRGERCVFVVFSLAFTRLCTSPTRCESVKNCALFVTLSAVLGAIVLGAALMIVAIFFLVAFPSSRAGVDRPGGDGRSTRAVRVGPQ
jgi:hypothetical protein